MKGVGQVKLFSSWYWDIICLSHCVNTDADGAKAMGIELLEPPHQSRQEGHLYLWDGVLHHRTLSVNNQLHLSVPSKVAKMIDCSKSPPLNTVFWSSPCDDMGNIPKEQWLSWGILQLFELWADLAPFHGRPFLLERTVKQTIIMRLEYLATSLPPSSSLLLKMNKGSLPVITYKTGSICCQW